MKLVIFDCDGTLVDSQHSIVAAIGRAFASLELDAPCRADVMSIIGLSLPEAFRHLAPEETAQTQNELAEQYKSAFTEIRQQHDLSEVLYPGIKTIIDSLAERGDVSLAIATGKSRAGVDRLLKNEGWQDAFQSIQTADTHPSKPHPAMVLAALDECSVAPHDAVMIGDTTFDMAMAVSAKSGALGVNWGYHPAEDLERAGAKRVSQATEHLLDDIAHVFEHQAGTVDETSDQNS